MPRLRRARKLTHRQKLFVLGVLGGESQTDAARGAGYSPKSAAVIASELVKIPIVAKAIDDGLKRIAKKSGRSLDAWLAKVDQSHTLAVGFAQDGRHEALGGLNKALELEGKACGHLVDKHEIDVNIRTHADLVAEAMRRAKAAKEKKK